MGEFFLDRALLENDRFAYWVHGTIPSRCRVAAGLIVDPVRRSEACVRISSIGGCVRCDMKDPRVMVFYNRTPQKRGPQPGGGK